jgi:hypothetical protein
MFRLAFLVSLFFVVVSANAAPSVALKCPCSLKTLSDSVIEIEAGLEEVARNPEYEELRLELWAYPYEMRSAGSQLAVVDISNRQDLFGAESGTKVKAKLRDRNRWSLTVPNRLYLSLYQENELVDQISLAADPVHVPLHTQASPDGWAIGGYPNFSRDDQDKTIRIDNLLLENFSSAALEGKAIAALQLCKAKEGPRAFGSCIDSGFAEFSQSLSLSIGSGESSSYSIEGTFDLSLIPLSRVPERYTDLWLEVEFNEETIFQALGSIEDGSYQNYKLDTKSPDLFLDSNDDDLLDHHEKIFGLTTQILDEPLDIYLLYGDAISEELGENLEARAMLGVSLAERMLQEAGVDAQIRILGMISVGDDVGLLNDEIIDRMRDADGPWADAMASAGENADFIFYLHNDVEEDTSDGVARVNGSGQGGLLSAEKIIERGSHVSVVDIDGGTRVSTFAHELGHLLGLGHSRRQVYESLEENDRNATPGTFPWSLGHGVDSEFVTTMGNESKFNVSQRLELFSDPTKNCNGSFGCGINRSNALEGADAATTLRFTYPQAKKISDGRAPIIYRRYWNQILQIPQGNFWMELDYGAVDVVDGVIGQGVKTIKTYDLEVLGRQSIVLEAQNSLGRSVRLVDFVEILSDADRDAISDAEELAVGTDPDDQSSCFDCYVFQNGIRAGLRGTHGSDFLDPNYDASLTDAFITSYGLGGDDFIYGLEKDDALFGGAGSDVLRGYDGADELFGGPDRDFLYGGLGDDILSGDEASDILRGEEGNDLLIGGEGYDSLYGGAGNDKLIIEKGGGILSGDAGSDILFVNTEFDEEENGYFVRGFEFKDSLALPTSIETVRSGVFSNTGKEFQAIELSNNSTIFISTPFVGMPELSQIICSSDTSLDDYSAFRGGSVNCDLDGDQVVDSNDSFPLDRFETVDTDLDGIGNNADGDDDNDGFTDEEELADGTDPLSRFSCRTGCVLSFDVDGNLEAKALTDGLLVIRHLFGFSGDALTSDGVVAGGANRKTSEAIAKYLTEGDLELDIDGNGKAEPLTDGMLLIRYLYGFSGESLIKGAIGAGAVRDTAEEVEAYIKVRVPTD